MWCRGLDARATRPDVCLPANPVRLEAAFKKSNSLQGEVFDEPLLHGCLYERQLAEEEVVCFLDPNEFLRFGRGGDYLLDNLHRSVDVFCAADEKLGLRAGGQIFVTVATACGFDGEAERDNAGYAWIVAAGAHANVGAEREAGEEGRQAVLLLQPVERGADIVLLAASFIVHAFAEAGAAKVKA